MLVVNSNIISYENEPLAVPGQEVQMLNKMLTVFLLIL